MLAPRYYVRYICVYPGGSFNMHDDSFDTEDEIKQWAQKHSYTEHITGMQVEWSPYFVYDRKENKDITSKFH